MPLPQRLATRETSGRRRSHRSSRALESSPSRRRPLACLPRPSHSPPCFRFHRRVEAKGRSRIEAPPLSRQAGEREPTSRRAEAKHAHPLSWATAGRRSAPDFPPLPSVPGKEASPSLCVWSGVVVLGPGPAQRDLPSPLCCEANRPRIFLLGIDGCACYARRGVGSLLSLPTTIWDSAETNQIAFSCPACLNQW